MDLEKIEPNPESKSENELVIIAVRKRVNMVRSQEKAITPADIYAVRKSLEKLPNLVVNFDDTITKPPEKDPNDPDRKRDNYSIRAICREIIALGSNQPEFKTNKERAEYFLQVLDGRLADKEKLITERKRLMEIFYSEVLVGLTEVNLGALYEKVINNEDPKEAIRLNENFVAAVKIIANGLENKTVSLFVLSLNTPDLMGKWYAKFLPIAQEELAKDGIALELVELMGNQIDWETSGSVNRVKGIIKHVTNENKHQYIPIGTIMLADDRETTDRAQDFVNVINIEEKSFNPDLISYAKSFSKISEKVTKSGLNLYNLPKEILPIYDELTIALKNITICSEFPRLSEQKKQSLSYDISGLQAEELEKHLQNNITLFNNNRVIIEEYLEERSKADGSK